MSPTSPTSLLPLVLDREPTIGQGRLVCVDGPAGAGKTTLAQDIADAFAGPGEVRVVHMDDLYAGWSGLLEVDAQLADLLLPLAAGGPGCYRRFDWLSGEYAETVTVEPVPLLVIEGVGSGACRFDGLCTLLVWVDAPYEVRMRRGLERDGDTFAPHWQQWAADEAELFARERTRERADVVVDGSAPGQPSSSR